MAVISRVKFQISGVVGSLGENYNFLVQWDLMFKQILVTKPKKNQALLSQSFKMLPELEKSNTWSSNGNNFKI